MLMQIIISDKWLNSCGKMHLSGKPLEVIKIRDFGPRGKFYTVVTSQPTETTYLMWEVWEVRGITIVKN